MTKSGLFYQDMIHLRKKINKVHIIVNDSRSPIPQVEENIHITCQLVKQILQVVDNNIL